MSAPSNRRSFLGGLAAVFAATPVIAAVPAATPLPIVEAPELLAIGDQLPGLLDAFRAALKSRDESVGLFESQCLPIPIDLVLPPPSPQTRWADYCEITRENINFLTGKRIDDKRVYDAKALKVHIIQQDVSRTTKEGRRLRRLVRIATQFETKRDAGLKVSGYLDADEACSDAAYEIERLAIAAVKAPLPRTRHGVEILARLTSAIGELADEFGNGVTIVNKAAALGRRLADATMSVEAAR
jgi:hypothetical protein